MASRAVGILVHAHGGADVVMEKLFHGVRAIRLTPVWAMAYRPERGWGVPEAAPPDLTATIAGLERRIAALENAQHRPVT